MIIDGRLVAVAKESASTVLSIGGQEVQITNPEKLYFSSQIKVTKLELVQYYLSVAPGALAGIQDRPIVLKRFVNGAWTHKSFWQPRKVSNSLGALPGN